MHRYFEAGGLTLSAIESEPEATTATVLALHGGGYSARYWGNPLDEAGSLLNLGPKLGYRVVALDRPGYGASHGLIGDAVRVARQADVVLEVIAQLRQAPDTGQGLFLIGHSLGAILALHVAAAAPAGAIAGIDISGLPYIFDMGMDASVLEQIDYLPSNPMEVKRDMFYGPDGTFDPQMLSADDDLSLPIPAAEIIDAIQCPRSTPTLAPRIGVPVQITRAEYENSSDGGFEGLQQCASLFTAAPRVVTHWQVASGHNISLHLVARAYHLRAFAFFDEALGAS